MRWTIVSPLRLGKLTTGYFGQADERYGVLPLPVQAEPRFEASYEPGHRELTADGQRRKR